MNDELLNQLMSTMAANEEAQRKFRAAVLIRLSRIETIVSMVHGAQITEPFLQKSQSQEKIDKKVEEAEAFIVQKSDELGMAMVNFIYGESETPGAMCEVRNGRPTQREQM